MIPEEMLRTAAAGAWERYYARLTAEYAPGQPFPVSEAFEKKIRRLMRRADHPVLYRTVRRVAAVLLALLIAGTVWLAVDEEARASFFGWIEERIGIYSVYHREGMSNSAIEPADYRPTWLPDGYELFDVLEASNSTIVVYSNQDNLTLRFIYLKNNMDPYMFVDTTDTETVETTVNHDPATLFVSQRETVASAIVWSAYNDTMFFVSGFVSEQELIRIAESVQPNN